MKTPSDELFQLIKSLDEHERRHFKHYSSRKKGSNNYNLLFDAIAEQKAYDENLLKSDLKNDGLVNNLKQVKSQLYDRILISLGEYHSDASAKAQLHKLIEQAEVLIAKKLTGQAKKLLLKAEKMALEHEAYDCLISICSLKAKVMASGMNIKEMEEHLIHEELQEEKYVERIKNIIKFRHLVSQLQLVQSTYTYSKAKDEQQIKKINSLLASPLLSSPAKALSFSALEDYYFIYVLSALLLDKFDHAAYKRQKEWVLYIESDKERSVKRADTYLAALMNLMSIEKIMNKSDAAESSYKKIKYFYFSLPSIKKTKALSEILARAIITYMMMHIQRGNPEKALKTWEEIKEHVSVNKFNHMTFLAMCDNFSCSYFMLGNYHDALKWANKILSVREKNALDLQAVVKIYSLMIHYELGNYDTLPYVTRSAQRFLMKHSCFSEFEKIMINFFKKNAPLITDQQEQIETFSNLKTQLEVLVKKHKQILAFDHFDYISWIESKIENRSFLQIVRKKAKR